MAVLHDVCTSLLPGPASGRVSPGLADRRHPVGRAQCRRPLAPCEPGNRPPPVRLHLRCKHPASLVTHADCRRLHSFSCPYNSRRRPRSPVRTRPLSPYRTRPQRAGRRAPSACVHQSGRHPATRSLRVPVGRRDSLGVERLADCSLAPAPSTRRQSPPGPARTRRPRPLLGRAPRSSAAGQTPSESVCGPDHSGPFDPPVPPRLGPAFTGASRSLPSSEERPRLAPPGPQASAWPAQAAGLTTWADLIAWASPGGDLASACPGPAREPDRRRTPPPAPESTRRGPGPAPRPRPAPAP